MTKTPSQIRQDWLEAALKAAGKLLREHGYTMPANIRIGVGFPKGRHSGAKVTLAQCWPSVRSSDKTFEIFITPQLQDTAEILKAVIHEAIHATVGCECGHKGAFKKCALAVGFVGPMTTTPVGPILAAIIKRLIAELGKYPAGALSLDGRKKQTTRLLKCICADCDYTVRTTRFWIEKAGPPICPTDDISLTCEAIDEEEGE